MGAMKVPGLSTGRREIHYPESDGKPMAETDWHWQATVELTMMLKAHYADAPDVYVASDLLIYTQEGNPRAAVAPDVFVVFGVPKGPRRIYKLWEEHAAPAVVFELTSRKTRREDLVTKRAQYARLGVAEYFLFDPEADYLLPPLQGLRLEGGKYVAMATAPDGTLRCEALGIDLRADGSRLMLRDVATGERLPWIDERDAARVAAEVRLAEAEAETAALRAELARLRGAG